MMNDNIAMSQPAMYSAHSPSPSPPPPHKTIEAYTINAREVRGHFLQ